MNRETTMSYDSKFKEYLQYCDDMIHASGESKVEESQLPAVVLCHAVTRYLKSLSPRVAIPAVDAPLDGAIKSLRETLRDEGGDEDEDKPNAYNARYSDARQLLGIIDRFSKDSKSSPHDLFAAVEAHFIDENYVTGFLDGSRLRMELVVAIAAVEFYQAKKQLTDGDRRAAVVYRSMESRLAKGEAATVSGESVDLFAAQIEANDPAVRHRVLQAKDARIHGVRFDIRLVDYFEVAFAFNDVVEASDRRLIEVIKQATGDCADEEAVRQISLISGTASFNQARDDAIKRHQRDIKNKPEAENLQYYSHMKTASKIIPFTSETYGYNDPIPTATSEVEDVCFIMHGWLDSGAAHDPLIKAFMEKKPNSVVVTCDLPGFGFSQKEPADPQRMALMMRKQIARLKVLHPKANLHVFGHSMSGGTLLREREYLNADPQIKSVHCLSPAVMPSILHFLWYTIASLLFKKSRINGKPHEMIYAHGSERSTAPPNAFLHSIKTLPMLFSHMMASYKSLCQLLQGGNHQKWQIFTGRRDGAVHHEFFPSHAKIEKLSGPTHMLTTGDARHAVADKLIAFAHTANGLSA